MIARVLPLLALTAVASAGCARAQPAPPAWVAEKTALSQKIGIDPTADFVEAANYHWSWMSHGEVVAGQFRCPPGSIVDVSRSIVVVRTTAPQACHGQGGEVERMLKVFPDGSAERLGG
jgi:hypothetical protein